MKYNRYRFWIDLTERVAWTCAQAALGVVTAEVLGLDGQWAIVFATVAAIAKGFVAKQIGNSDSASTAPSM